MITDYEKRFNLIPKKSIDLAKLQRSRLSTEKLYLLIEEKFNEAAIQEKSEFGYVEVVDPALVPDKPIRPRKLLNLSLGGLLGFGFGFALVFFRERVSLLVRTPEDLQKHGFPILSSIGRIKADSRYESVRGGDGRHFDPILVTLQRPRHFRAWPNHSGVCEPICSMRSYRPCSRQFW